MGEIELAGDEFDNPLVISYSLSIIRSEGDGICISRLAGTQSMVLVILSDLVALIYTLYQ